MSESERYLKEFELESIKHYNASLEGDWKVCNKSVKKIHHAFEYLKRNDFLDQLLILVNNKLPEVRAMAALYCLPIDPPRFIEILKEIEANNDSILGFSAGQAIKNWENEEYYLWTD